MINEDSMPTFPEKLLDIIRKNKIKKLLVVIINNPQIIFLAHYKFFFFCLVIDYSLNKLNVFLGGRKNCENVND